MSLLGMFSEIDAREDYNYHLSYAVTRAEMRVHRHLHLTLLSLFWNLEKNPFVVSKFLNDAIPRYHIPSWSNDVSTLLLLSVCWKLFVRQNETAGTARLINHESVRMWSQKPSELKWWILYGVKLDDLCHEAQQHIRWTTLGPWVCFPNEMQIDVSWSLQVPLLEKACPDRSLGQLQPQIGILSALPPTGKSLLNSMADRATVNCPYLRKGCSRPKRKARCSENKPVLSVHGCAPVEASLNNSVNWCS